jgi:hypothetical protein
LLHSRRAGGSPASAVAARRTRPKTERAATVPQRLRSRFKGGEIAQQVADTVTDKLAGQNIDHKIGEVVEAVSSTVTQGLSRSSRPIAPNQKGSACES